MASRAIVTAFHKYQPYGGEYYEPILDFYLKQMKKFEDEYDQVYLVDSTWNIDPERVKDMKVTIIRVNPSLRYYDAYKEVLPQVKEDLVLFLDDDMVIYSKYKISYLFLELIRYSEPIDYHFIWEDGSLVPKKDNDVVTIMDTIGEYKTNKLKKGNKFCPYLFAVRKNLLMKYLNVEWGPDMPYCETLGHLTEAMVKDNVKVVELEDDKSNILFDGTKDGKEGKNLGYYHIRAGSTPAVLLAYKDHDPDKYWEYLKNQPRNEYLRQCMWYQYMGGNPAPILVDVGVPLPEALKYYFRFTEYHGL